MVSFKLNLNLKQNELDLIKPYYTVNELNRYYSNNDNQLWVIYTKSNIGDNIDKYPNIKKHFDKFKEIITGFYA